VLNYRRYHSGRPRKNLQGRLDDVARTQTAIFADPRCSKDALELGQFALKHHLMVVMSLAYLQEETHLAQKFMRELVKMDPRVLEGEPSEFIDFMTSESIADESLNHEDVIDRVIRQLPPEYSWLSAQLDRAKATGALVRGLRSVAWNRIDRGHMQLLRAKELGVQIHPQMVLFFLSHLLSYETAFEFDKTMSLLERVTESLEMIGQGQSARSLREKYLVMRAFESYFSGNFERVPEKVVRAVTEYPKHVMNRGVLSILVRSIFRSLVAGRAERSQISVSEFHA
jgi:hypothetical protein